MIKPVQSDRYCQTHRLKKDHSFCLEINCTDRLICSICFQKEQKHKNHRTILIDPFIKHDHNELQKLLGDLATQIISYTGNNIDGHGDITADVQSFMELFDKELQEYLDQREQLLKTAIQKMMDDFRMLMMDWKHQQYENIKWSALKDIQQIKQHIQYLFTNTSTAITINTKLETDQIKKDIDKYDILIQTQQQLQNIKLSDQQMLDQLLSAINQQINHQNKTMKHYLTNIIDVRQLYQSKDVVNVWNYDCLQQNMNQILQYQYNNQQYRIWIDLGYDSTLIYKNKMVDMIQHSNSNHKVGRITIKLEDTNPIDQQLISKMINNYHNVYWIVIQDELDSVSAIHQYIQQFVKQSNLLGFTLTFWKGLAASADGLQLLKQYNQLIAQKQYLEQIWYEHTAISKRSESKEEIQFMIEHVNNM